jgi:multiple sugar transport system permease protein
MGFIPQMAIALLFASWFTNVKLRIRGQGFFKVVFYMPNIMTAATIGALYLAFINGGGIIHQIAVSAGYIESNEVLRDIWFTRGSIASINAWMWFGNSMIILMAAINSINVSLFEAARIDGANTTKIFWKVTSRWSADSKCTIFRGFCRTAAKLPTSTPMRRGRFWVH